MPVVSRLLSLTIITFALSLTLGLGGLAVGARVYGDELVYITNRYTTVTENDIYSLDVARMLRVQRATDLRWLLTPPTWLPDGSGIVLMISDGVPLMLNIGARRLRPADMDLPRNALALAYAPDGGRVAYTRIDHDGFQTLHIRNLRTGSEAQITPDLTNAFVPVWSPDGRWLAFSWSPVANAEIYVVDADPDRSPVADNPRPRRLTFNYNLDTYPAWSPDGRWIAFVSDRDGNTEIYVVDAARGEAAEDNDGGSVIRLTHDPARTLDPKWSPDGRWISYIAEHGGQRRLHMIATDCALAAEGECAPQIVPLTDSTHGNVWMAIWRPR